MKRRHEPMWDRRALTLYALTAVLLGLYTLQALTVGTWE